MSESDPVRIVPLGEAAVVVEFGTVISRELNARAISLARRLGEDAEDLPGYVESVPAFASTTVFFDPIVVSRNAAAGGESSFEFVRGRLVEKIAGLEATGHAAGRTIEIAARFGGEYSPDLSRAAEMCGLLSADFIEIFLSRSYHVYMLGFLPGFAYLGEVDERIAVDRLPTPRTVVPAGSIGIAGRQTGVYPLASPGGWQLIGRTSTKMFDPSAERLSLLQPGDTVRFVRE
ncbi:MAG: 5-oxoprolinase subunit PxpB [Pyrinomonadaceae bacterium]